MIVSIKLCKICFHVFDVQVYLAKFPDKEDQVILNTQWFTTEIIGAAFAGEEFRKQFKTLPNKHLYSQQELRDFFTEKMDVDQLLALLNHMDLVHETEDKKYLLPGKLPDHGPEIVVNPVEGFEVKGISIECAEEIDMFNPSVYPCLEKKILDERKGFAEATRLTMKYAVGSSEIFIHHPKHKQAINVAVVYQGTEFMEDAYTNLEYAVEFIESELREKSPGTKLRRSYISQTAICQNKNLEDVQSFTEENIVEAEQKDRLLRRDVSSRPEKVNDLLFKGYDKLLLRRLGTDCRYEWLPAEAVKRIFGRLDVENRWREDYRSVAKVLKVPDHEVKRLVEESKSRRESVTSRIIKEWCVTNKKKMTIGMLRRLLRDLSLEDNIDAMKALDEVIDNFPARVRMISNFPANNK